MRLSFLQAPMPLTKQYSGGSGGIKKTSYPNAYEVTSHDLEVKNLKSFEALMKTHAAAGHCMVKGELLHPLVNQSRAGSTDTNASTEWICLDIDGLPVNYEEEDTKRKVAVTIATLLDAIGLGDCSYILQWSASYGIENKCLRAHIIILLDKAYPAPLIKQWLMALNLNTPMLRASISLTKTGNALSWPLDISACQNDKLIYIAPPVLKGITDPLGKSPRITLVKGVKERLTLPLDIPSPAKNREAMHKRLDELRLLDGLPKRKTTYKLHGSMEVLSKPDTCIITDMKVERGFVYFNLNGGDSWGYFHPESNPDYIHNFKGEPVYMTKELLPEYWEQLHKQTNRVASNGIMKMAFLDPKTDRYWRGEYDTQQDNLTLESTSSALALRHFAKSNGIPLLDDVIPEWTLTFDPHDNVRVDLANQSVNMFQPSQYMRATAKQVKTMPKIIKKVIFHMGGSDQAVFDYFINWLAYVLQERDRPLTAWVFHGRTGTGKGTFLMKILKPIFGHEYVAVPRMKELEKEFNGFVEKSLIVAVDEIEVDAMENESGIMADMRRYITEEFIPMRKMHRDTVKVRNYAAYLFFSNKSAPVRVPREDRRLNVGMYQPNRLVITDQELEQIETELQAFHDYLLYFTVDKSKVITPLENAAREDMIELSESAVDGVSNALLSGNMMYFIDQLPTDNRYTGDNRALLRVEDYKSVIKALLQRTERNSGVCNIARDELRAIYEYTVGKMPESPNKFTSLIKHHRITMKKVWLSGKTVNGIKVEWKDLAAWNSYLAAMQPAPTAASAAAPAAPAKPRLARVK